MDGGAQLPVGFRCRRNRRTAAADLRRQLDGGNDLHIAGAAAIVVAQRVANLLLRRVGILIQQGLCAHDHARNTKSALHSTGLAVGIGIELLFIVAQALHRDDMLTVKGIGKRCAGAAGFAVDDHRAGAFAAAVLHGSQVQFVAEITDQFLIFFYGDRSAVYSKPCHGRFSFSL